VPEDPVEVETTSRLSHIDTKRKLVTE